MVQTDFIMAEFIQVRQQQPSVRYPLRKNSGMTLQELQSGQYDLPSNVRAICVYYMEKMPEVDQHGNKPLNPYVTKGAFLFVDGEIYDQERLTQESANTQKKALKVMQESGAELVVKTKKIKGDKSFPFKPFHINDAVISQDEEGIWKVTAVHPQANANSPKFL